MKLVHLADLHLGSEMSAHLSPAKAQARRGEICTAFLRAVEYADGIGAQAVLIAGDAFDTALPLRRDKEFFYGIIRDFSHITFFYLKGNHDGAEKVEELPNLKTFGKEWTSYDLGDGVCVSGIELCEENSTTYYADLHLDFAKKNIVMLHGQVAGSVGLEQIHLRSLENKGIDYLALGHIHAYSTGKIDGRGVYAYAGCLEPRGFDEFGAKGFITLDTEGQGVAHSFVENSQRSVEEVTVDVSGCKDFAQVFRKVDGALTVDADDMPRIYLVGEVDMETDGLAEMVWRQLSGKYFAISVKDRTTKALDLEKYKGQVSLEGEFVRVVMANSTLDERQKKQVISLGLKALSGEKL